MRGIRSLDIVWKLARLMYCCRHHAKRILWSIGKKYSIQKASAKEEIESPETQQEKQKQKVTTNVLVTLHNVSPELDSGFLVSWERIIYYLFLIFK